MASPVPIDASAFSPTHYSTFLDISMSMGFPVMTITRGISHIYRRSGLRTYIETISFGAYGLLPGSSLRSVSLSTSTENRGISCTHLHLVGYQAPVHGYYVGGLRTKHEDILQALSTISTYELRYRELGHAIYQVDFLAGDV